MAIYERKAGKCSVHDDLAWLYDDDSIGCLGAQVLETSTLDCRWEPMPAEWAADRIRAGQDD